MINVPEHITEKLGHGDLKNFANSQPSASNFKCFSWSLEQSFLTVCVQVFFHSYIFHSKLLNIIYKALKWLDFTLFLHLSSCFFQLQNRIKTLLFYYTQEESFIIRHIFHYRRSSSSKWVYLSKNILHFCV
jgi:hypothetical protein